LLCGLLCVAIAGMAMAAEPEAKPAGKYGYLGVSLGPVPEALADQLGLKRGEGMLVTEVAEDSPAQRAGFEANDVIVKVDDQIVLAEEQLRKLIGYTTPGNPLTIGVIRKAKRQTLTATLGATDQKPTMPEVRWSTVTPPFFHIPPGGANEAAHIRIVGPDGKPIVMTMKGGEDLVKQLEAMKERGQLDAKTLKQVRKMIDSRPFGPDGVIEEPGGEPDARLDKKISVDFIDTPMADVLAFLRSTQKLNIIVDPALAKRNPQVTLEAQEWSVRDVLDWLRMATECEYAVANGVIGIGRAEFVKQFKAIKPLATDNEVIAKELNKLLSFDFVTTPIPDAIAFLRGLLDGRKINIIVMPSDHKEPSLTLKVDKVPAGLALQYFGLLTGRPVAIEKQAVVIKTPVVKK
jgi:hypothetical protein